MKYTYEEILDRADDAILEFERSEARALEIAARKSVKKHEIRSALPLIIEMVRDTPLVNFQKARVAFQKVRESKGTDYGLIRDALARYEIAVDDLIHRRIHPQNGHALSYELDTINAYLDKRHRI